MTVSITFTPSHDDAMTTFDGVEFTRFSRAPLVPCSPYLLLSEADFCSGSRTCRSASVRVRVSGSLMDGWMVERPRPAGGGCGFSAPQ